ncbi:MAG TPA: hypothetical protein VKZ96_10680, partial [Thermomicrobiales bacterium]|nr:hypothetical protein [Thermomicrobiales bacterium]
MSHVDSESPRRARTEVLQVALQSLHPAYFALVMATGIVSIAAQLEGMRSIAIALFWINLLAYALLWLLTLGRLTLYFPRFLDDFTDHARAPGFFTAVAGTGVLGSQCIVLFGQREAAFVLWGVELLLWIVITYGIFTALIVKREKPEFIRGLTAGWLVS